MRQHRLNTDERFEFNADLQAWFFAGECPISKRRLCISVWGTEDGWQGASVYAAHNNPATPTEMAWARDLVFKPGELVIYFVPRDPNWAPDVLLMWRPPLDTNLTYPPLDSVPPNL